VTTILRIGGISGSVGTSDKWESVNSRGEIS
jgi:hypothetical protein